MNDILPPKKNPRPDLLPQPIEPPIAQPPLVLTPKIELKHQPIDRSGLKKTAKRFGMSFAKKPVFYTIGIVVTLLVGMGIAAMSWYIAQLVPASSDKQILVVVDIPAGTSPTDIGKLLAEKTIIRSSYAFDIHTGIAGVRSKLQAGTYRLSPAESLPAIVDHLVNGKADQFQITFLPGATLDQNKRVLLKAGYSQSAIDEAFSRSYTSPLFGGAIPLDLEGYIYGETYSFGVGASVEDILQYTFDEYYRVLQKDKLAEGFAAQGLSLREGIILASIIQREAFSYDDMRQIAQVFLLRLKIGMMLGSDVTYQYITDKLGVPRDINYNSPYNTRRFAGLPPGPISSPGENALRAVANPSDGDYLFFLSGDDDITYFARTDAEHQQNKIDHCKIKCSVL